MKFSESAHEQNTSRLGSRADFQGRGERKKKKGRRCFGGLEGIFDLSGEGSKVHERVEERTATCGFRAKRRDTAVWKEEAYGWG